MGMRVRMRVALAFWMGGTNRMSRGQNEPARFNPFGANQLSEKSIEVAN